MKTYCSTLLPTPIGNSNFVSPSAESKCTKLLSMQENKRDELPQIWDFQVSFCSVSKMARLDYTDLESFESLLKKTGANFYNTKHPFKLLSDEMQNQT